MRLVGILVCVGFGGTGAILGFFLPASATVATIMAILAAGFAASDLVIQSAIKLIDDRVTHEVGKVQTAYRVVPNLTKHRQSLLDLSVAALVCKGVTGVTVAAVYTGKAAPWLLAVGGGALALGMTLTGVIRVTYRALAAQKDRDAVETAENKNAASGVQRLGDIDQPVDLPPRKIIRLAEDTSAPAKKPKKPKN